MAAGDPIPWSYIATRVATGTLTSDSGTWAGTETGSLLSVSPALVNGLKYGITLFTHISAAAVASPSAESSIIRIREDNATGNQLHGAQIYLGTASANGFALMAYTEFTAVATAAKTFVVTGQRGGGANNHQIRAGGTRPTFLTVELIPT